MLEILEAPCPENDGLENIVNVDGVWILVENNVYNQDLQPVKLSEYIGKQKDPVDILSSMRVLVRVKDGDRVVYGTVTADIIDIRERMCKITLHRTDTSNDDSGENEDFVNVEPLDVGNTICVHVNCVSTYMEELES